MDNTLVIITADHGEQFGEHGLMEHRNSYYLPLLHVPLLIIPPGGLATGIRIDEPVSLADLPETVTHLLGIAPSPFLGASLARYWSTSPWPGKTRPVFAGKYDVSIVQDRWHYIRTRQGTNPGHDVEELYDIVNDPDEERNLAGTSPAPAILLALRAVADSTGAKRPEDRSGTFAP
jgi:arylsulfatase A-like enzyme